MEELVNFWEATLRRGTKTENLCDWKLWWNLAEEERNLERGKYNEAVVRAIVLKH